MDNALFWMKTEAVKALLRDFKLAFEENIGAGSYIYRHMEEYVFNGRTHTE